MPDSYTWRARTAPFLITVLPAIPLVAGLVPTSALGRGAGIAFALLVILGTHLARDAGKRLEPQLWQTWGGPPTSRGLRFRDAPLPDRVDRLHQRVSEVVPEELPSSEMEASDPAGADQRYEEAVAVLRERTRDRSKFPLVFEENVSYGFRRNLLGLRPWGIAVSILSLAAAMGLLLFGGHTIDKGQGGWLITIVLSALLLAVWVFVVRPDWVKTAADTYAQRLFESTETLRQPPADPSTRA